MNLIFARPRIRNKHWKYLHWKSSIKNMKSRFLEIWNWCFEKLAQNRRHLVETQQFHIPKYRDFIFSYCFSMKVFYRFLELVSDAWLCKDRIRFYVFFCWKILVNSFLKMILVFFESYRQQEVNFNLTMSLCLLSFFKDVTFFKDVKVFFTLHVESSRFELWFLYLYLVYSWYQNEQYHKCTWTKNLNYW